MIDREGLLRDLAALGVQAGDCVMVHASLRKLGLARSQFGPAEDGTVVDAGRHAGVDAHPLAGGLEPQHQVLDVFRRHHRLELPGHGAPGVHEELVARLYVGPVLHPGVARHDPADVVGIHTLLQQPDAGIHAGLARPHDDIAGLRL